ncbi:MAG: PAS domain-containing protein, partial [Candidatus Pseudothioglobus sp.]
MIKLSTLTLSPGLVGRTNHKARYTCIGTLFGCNFVAAAWAIDLVASGLMPTIANIVQLHLNNPVIYIVDMAPFVLGFTFYYLGTVHAHLDAKAKSQHDSDTRFRALMNSSFDAIIIINTQGAIVDFNAAAEELFGYQKQQIVGDDLANIVIPLRYREAHGQGLKVFLETGVGPLIGQRVEIEAL